MSSKSTLTDTYEQAAGGTTVMKIKDLNQELMKVAEINLVHMSALSSCDK
jgi:hypothetical protein